MALNVLTFDIKRKSIASFLSLSWIIRSSERKGVTHYHLLSLISQSRCLGGSHLPPAWPCSSSSCSCQSLALSRSWQWEVLPEMGRSQWGAVGKELKVLKFKMQSLKCVGMGGHGIRWRVRVCWSAADSSNPRSPCCHVAIALEWLEDKKSAHWEGRAGSKVPVGRRQQVSLLGKIK